MWVHDGMNGKLDGRSNEGVWVGYNQDSTHAHRIYWPEKRTVSVERNVKFDSVPFANLIPPVNTPVQGEHEAETINQPVDKAITTEPTTKPSDEPAPEPIPSRTSSPIPENTQSKLSNHLHMSLVYIMAKEQWLVFTSPVAVLLGQRCQLG